MQASLIMRKSLKATLHINRYKEKTQTIILTDAEIALDKIQYPIIIKMLSN